MVDELPRRGVDEADVADDDGRHGLVPVGVVAHDRRVGRIVPDVVLDPAGNGNDQLTVSGAGTEVFDGARAEVRLFLDAAGMGARDVPDPYYTRDFDAALDLIEAGARGA